MVDREVVPERVFFESDADVEGVFERVVDFDSLLEADGVAESVAEREPVADRVAEPVVDPVADTDVVNDGVSVAIRDLLSVAVAVGLADSVIVVASRSMQCDAVRATTTRLPLPLIAKPCAAPTPVSTVDTKPVGDTMRIAPLPSSATNK